MRKIIRTVFSSVFLLAGLTVLFDSSCKSISFAGGGGGRVTRYTCYPNGEGVIPSWLGGSLFVAIALVLMPWGLFAQILALMLGAKVDSSDSEKEFQLTEQRPDISPEELNGLAKPILSSGYFRAKGWYEDPARKYFERYWDGSNWTSKVRDADWKRQIRNRKSEVSKVRNIFAPVFEKNHQSSGKRNTEFNKTDSGLAGDLERLSELFSKGLLTESEFKDAKQRIIK